MIMVYTVHASTNHEDHLRKNQQLYPFIVGMLVTELSIL